MQLQHGIKDEESFINCIASRTGHLVGNSKLPIVFEPQKKLLLLCVWLLPTTVLAGTMLARWKSDGEYGMLWGTATWFCLGLLAWLFGVNRILVDPESITIDRRATSKTIQYSDARSIVLGVGGTQLKFLALTIVLKSGERVDLVIPESIRSSYTIYSAG